MSRSVSTNWHRGRACVRVGFFPFFWSTLSSRSCSRALSSSPLTWIVTSVRGRAALSAKVWRQTTSSQSADSNRSQVSMCWWWRGGGAEIVTAAISTLERVSPLRSFDSFAELAAVACFCTLHSNSRGRRAINLRTCPPPVGGCSCLHPPSPLSTLIATHLFHSEYEKKGRQQTWKNKINSTNHKGSGRCDNRKYLRLLL